MKAADEELPLASRVLLIEDSEDDVVLFRRLLAQARIEDDLDVVTDGETAIRWLSEKIGESVCGRPILPRAIFIDIKLPGMLGTEVLRWIRAQPALERTLTVICTASIAEQDLTEAERLGAHAFLPKFPKPAQLKRVMAAENPGELPVELTGYAMTH